jgi:hypothetical protein
MRLWKKVVVFHGTCSIDFNLNCMRPKLERAVLFEFCARLNCVTFLIFTIRDLDTDVFHALLINSLVMDLRQV